MRITRKTMKAMNAILYCRVSTDEQADSCSLDVQENYLRAYCGNHGYNIVGVYREDYSAKLLTHLCRFTVRAALRLTICRFSCRYGYRRCHLVRRRSVLSGFSLPTPFNELFRQFAAVSLPGLCRSCKAGSGILTASSSGSPVGLPLVPGLPSGV